MGKPEYIVMGSWAVQRSTGKVRHLPCRRWCTYFNHNNTPEHPCRALTEDLGEITRIPIPAMVITMSEIIRNKSCES